MDVAVMIALASALWFILVALQNLLTALSASEPGRSVILFIYCLIAGLVLFYEGGFLFRH